MNKYKIDTVIKATDKGIKLPDDYQPAFKNLLAFVKKNRGGFLRVTLAPPSRKRTTGYKSQNHAINGFIQQICMVTGNEIVDAKIFFKQKAIKRGYPFLYNDDDEIVYSLLNGEALGASETTIDTIQAGYLIDEIKQYADENGIKLIEVKQ